MSEREAVARIIDPWAWDMLAEPVNQTGFDYSRNQSLAKADAILALSAAPSPVVGGEELGGMIRQSVSAPESAAGEAEPSGPDDALLRQVWGALNFILAFYQPSQRYLDTEAWKKAEAGGKLAHDALSERLGNPPGWWRKP